MIAISAQIVMKAIMVLAGIYGWEIFTTLDVERDLIMGRRKFKWPMAFYLANRYAYFGSIISAAVLNGGSVYQPVNCIWVFHGALIFASLAMGLSSTNLAIRTVAIWKRNIYVSVGLFTTLSAHWLLIIAHQTMVRAEWVTGKGCIVEEQGYKFLLALLGHCLVFDTAVLALNTWKLGKDARRPIHMGGSRVQRSVTLTQVVFDQGLTYFVFAFICHLITIVGLIISPDLGGLLLLIDEALISIIACRAVRALLNFSPTAPAPLMFGTELSDLSRTFRSAFSNPKQTQDTSMSPSFQTEITVQVERHCDDDLPAKSENAKWST